MGLAPLQVPTECSMSSAKKQTAKASFEIKKGTRQVMTLSEAEVEKYLDLQELLNGLEDGIRGRIPRKLGVMTHRSRSGDSSHSIPQWPVVFD